MVIKNTELVIKTLFNLFDTELRELPIEPFNWGIRGLNKFVNHSVVSMILSDIDAKIQANLSPDRLPIFEDEACIENLILMSGGNKRILYRFLYDLFGAVGRIETLPITQKNTARVITSARDIQRRTVDAKDWGLLARVYLDPLISCSKSTDYQNLIRSKSLLDYTGYPSYWLVNPLVEKIDAFQEALKNLTSPQ
jgi:hypothetical protein